jgi:hypothetical protein
MAATAKLMAFLGMNPSGFNSGVDQAGKKVRSFEGVLSGMKGKLAAAFSIGAIVAAGKAVADTMGVLADTAENLNVTTDQLQGLGFMAKQVGLDLGDVSAALGKLSAIQADFVSGGASDEVKDKLKALGFATPDQADAMNAAEFFEAISKGAQASSEGLTAALQMLGRAGPKFQAVMRGVAGIGLSGAVEASREAGGLISQEDIQATDAAMDGLVERIKRRFVKAGAVVVAALSRGANALTGDGAGVLTDDQSARAKRNQEARVRADEEAAKKIIEETAEIRQKMAYDAMTDAEKRLEIERQIAELDAKRMSANTATAWAQRDKERAELEAKLAGMPAGMTRNAAPVDSLRQIGVVGGTAVPSPADLQRKLLVEAQKQGKYSAEMVRLLREKKGGVF